MNLSRNDERVLALAGIMQACYLVTGLARTGLVGQDSLAGTLETIFVTNPEITLDVYQGGNGVRTGLRLITELLGDLSISEHGDTVRYALAVVSLEKRMRQTPEILRAIGAGISGIHEHRCINELSVTDEEIVDRVSRLYEDTAASVEPRIKVQGQQTHLKNPINTKRIRALLLAALRSAVLWRQLDGRLPQLILSRGALLRSADRVADIIS